MSWLRHKNGKHPCGKCQGSGCYTCERKGYILMCPCCADIDTQEESEEHFCCGVCNTEYDESGEIVTDTDTYENT